MCYQRPRGTEGQKSNSFVTRPSPEEVTNKVVATIINHAYDRNSRQQGECVLRNPFPEENGGELKIKEQLNSVPIGIEEILPYHNPEESSPFEVQGTVEMQTLKQVYNRYVGWVEGTWENRNLESAARTRRLIHTMWDIPIGFALDNLLECITERKCHIYAHIPAMPYPVRQYVRTVGIFLS